MFAQSLSAAFLVLGPASARAGLVPANFAGNDRFWPHHLAIGKIPGPFVLLEMGELVMLTLRPLFPVVGDEFDVAFGIVRSPLAALDDLKPFPVGARGPLLRPLVIVSLPMVGMGGCKDKIGHHPGIGRIACSHQFYRRFGGARAGDDRFAAIGIGGAASARTAVHVRFSSRMAENVGLSRLKGLCI